VAALHAGDAVAAREIVAVTRPRLQRGAEDVRGALIDAWIADAARRSPAPAR
jgi:hypothetical protein